MNFVFAGKVFPKLRRKGRTLTSLKNGEDAEDETTDYVFRIVSKVRHEDFCKYCCLKFPGYADIWTPLLPESRKLITFKVHLDLSCSC